MQGIKDYINSFYALEEGLLGLIQQNAYDNNVPIIPLEVVAFLKTLLSSKQPKNILEIGCAIGFSASLFANTCPNAQITTIERYGYMIDKAKQNFDALGISKRINLIEKDAIEALPDLVELGLTYDFIFLDAGKGQYLNFLPHIQKLLAKNAILVADNILQDGTLVLDESQIVKRQRTTYRNMKQFLTNTFSDLFNATILPIGDGLLFATKLEES